VLQFTRIGGEPVAARIVDAVAYDKEGEKQNV
jgi:hypothetical protein